MAEKSPRQPSWFQKNNITANPTIVKLDRDGASAFYIDHYTGRSITARVGLPGFLCGSASAAKPDADKDNPPILYGAWANWNIMLREIYDANLAGEVTDELLLGIQSWVAEFASIEGEFDLAPPASDLQRFGGSLSDSAWDERFVSNSKRAISVQDDLAARALRQQQRKESAKEKPPTVGQTIAGMCDPNGVTVFDVAVFPANRGQYWVRRRKPCASDNEFDRRVCDDLGVRALPGNHAAASVCISPDANTKKANRILCKESEEAKKKKEQERLAVERERLEAEERERAAAEEAEKKKKEELKSALKKGDSSTAVKRSISFSRTTDSAVPADLYKLPNKRQMLQKKPVRRAVAAAPPTQDDMPWPSDVDSQAD